MIKAIDNYYLQQDEPVKSCLLALRDIILQQSGSIENSLSYGMPFFYYKGKRFCYLWVEKKTCRPYLGIVDGNKIHHPKLISAKRARMKIILFDPGEDLPLEDIRLILGMAIAAIGIVPLANKQGPS